MKPPTVRHGRSILILLIAVAAAGVPAPARAQKKPNLDANVIAYLDFEKLLERNQSLIVAAVDDYNNREHRRSISALQALLSGESIYQPKKPLRAWAEQWLAINYAVLADSLAKAREHARRSLDEDVEIWREYPYRKMPQDLRDIYQEEWQALQQAFDRKHKGFRLGLGTISRMDFSYRFNLLEIMVGVGAPLAVDPEEEKIRLRPQLLFYSRLQRLRRSIERLSAGYYVEVSGLEENWREDGFKLQSVVSVGSVIAYPYNGGVEFGGSFEVARVFLFRDEPGELPFVQRIKSTELKFFGTYANFEIYLRKWF